MRQFPRTIILHSREEVRITPIRHQPVILSIQDHPKKGLTLIEVLVAGLITSLLSVMVYMYFKRNFNAHERQKRVSELQRQSTETIESINRYLVGAGMPGDTAFYDPNKILDPASSATTSNRSAFQVLNNNEIIVYGNILSRGKEQPAATLSYPVTNSTAAQPTIVSRDFKKMTGKDAFKVGDFVYLHAGSAQEVAKVQALLNDTSISLSAALKVPYPRGSLIFPFSRVRIRKSPTTRDVLEVNWETANGAATIATRRFTPTKTIKQLEKDSVLFTINSVDKAAGRIEYTLGFYNRLNDRSRTWLNRTVRQTVFIRGF